MNHKFWLYECILLTVEKLSKKGLTYAMKTFLIMRPYYSSTLLQACSALWHQARVTADPGGLIFFFFGLFVSYLGSFWWTPYVILFSFYGIDSLMVGLEKTVSTLYKLARNISLYLAKLWDHSGVLTGSTRNVKIPLNAKTTPTGGLRLWFTSCHNWWMCSISCCSYE